MLFFLEGLEQSKFVGDPFVLFYPQLDFPLLSVCRVPLIILLEMIHGSGCLLELQDVGDSLLDDAGKPLHAYCC